MKPEDILYVSRVVIAVFIGLVSAILSSQVHLVGIILLMVGVYAGTVFTLPRIVGISGKNTRRSAITTGMATYVVFWLFSWIIFFNILY